MSNPNAVPQRSEQRVPQQKLQRYTKSGDRFYVDPKKIPEGMSYEWKRLTYIGKEDRDHMIDLQQNHWKPVPSGRHTELTDAGGDKPIVRDGLMLMERPAYLTKEARQEDRANANNQVNHQMARLQQDIGVSKDFRQTPVTVNRSFERTAVPDDQV